ncbi:hypothetical protein [Neobacillus sp. Marseille-QA0830]
MCLLEGLGTTHPTKNVLSFGPILANLKGLAFLIDIPKYGNVDRLGKLVDKVAVSVDKRYQPVDRTKKCVDKQINLVDKLIQIKIARLKEQFKTGNSSIQNENQLPCQAAAWLFGCNLCVCPNGLGTLNRLGMFFHLDQF